MSVLNYNSYFSLRVFIIERVYFLNKLNIRLDFDRRKRRIDSVEIHVDTGIAVIVQVINRIELIDLQTVLQHDEVVLDHIINTCLHSPMVMMIVRLSLSCHCHNDKLLI